MSETPLIEGVERERSEVRRSRNCLTFPAIRGSLKKMPENPTTGDPTMKITWYGHAAFLIETAGLRVILDPYRSPDSGGYEPIAEPADLVVVSHENDRYHSHLGQIVPPFEVIRALEVPPGGRPSAACTSRRSTSSRRPSVCPRTR